MVVTVCFFVFKQKTAYDMRISDWSSDVCSSDLANQAHPKAMVQQGAHTLSIPTDGRDPGSVKQAFETIRKELGTPDVLVYNAGGFKYGGILDLDPTE